MTEETAEIGRGTWRQAEYRKGTRDRIAELHDVLTQCPEGRVPPNTLQDLICVGCKWRKAVFGDRWKHDRCFRKSRVLDRNVSPLGPAIAVATRRLRCGRRRGQEIV